MREPTDKKVIRILDWLVVNYPEYWYETITHQPIGHSNYTHRHLIGWLKACRNINGFKFNKGV